VVRQAWLMAGVGALLIGFAFLLAVGCSGDTGSQPSGSQDSEVDQSEQTGSVRSASQDSESTVAGSQQGGAQDSESTHEVAEHCGSQSREESESPDQVSDHGGSIEHLSGYGGFLLRVDGIVYYPPFDGASNQMTYDTTTSKVVGRRLGEGDLGPLFAEVNPEATKESTNLTTTSSSATPDVVPVYAVKGYDTSFRLAACMGDRLIMFEALSNPKASEASELLDIDGKVSRIDVTHWFAAKDQDLVYGSIEDPQKVGRIVQELMDAPLKPTSSLHLTSGDQSNLFLIVFHLEDGTVVARDYRTDTGRLSTLASGAEAFGLERTSGVVTPLAFRGAIEEALKEYVMGYRKYFDLTRAERKRQELTCGDAQTTKEARRIGRGGMFYATNDVYPGGPWRGVLRGTEENDSLLSGENGEDEVYGLGGDDRLDGGACDDKLYGGPGDDGYMEETLLFSGGPGHDVLYGGPGRDRMYGDEGDDVLYGDPGNDELSGSEGKDVLYGGDGDDTLGPGKDGQRDELHCGIGWDIVYVGYSADKIDHADDSCEEKQRTSPAIE
jgi:hypothetical protein